MVSKKSFPIKLEIVAIGGFCISCLIALLLGSSDPKPEISEYRSSSLSVNFAEAAEVEPEKEETEGEIYAKKILEKLDYVRDPEYRKDFEGLDLEKLYRDHDFPLPEETIKYVDIRNKDGKPIGTKFYKKNGLVIISIMKNGELVSIQEVREKDGKYEGKSKVSYTNGDYETLEFTNGKKNGKSIYHFTNGDKEIYNYVDGVVKGNVTYIFADGTKETYQYQESDNK